MASLNGQTIAASYEQLLHVDADGGGNGTTHVSVKDGDNGTTFGFTIATDALMMTSTNRLEFGDNASYIHQSADGVLDLVSDTEIELNATTIEMNGAVKMVGSGATDQVLIENTNTGADNAPDLVLYRNSSSPADSDSIGRVEFRGRNDNSQDVTYANLEGVIIDASDGTEDSRLIQSIIKGGSSVIGFKSDDTEFAINESGVDMDFRVEAASSKTHALFVEGSSGNVGIGTGSPSAHLEIVGGTDYAQIKLTDTDSDNTTQRTGIVSQHNDSGEQDVRMIGMYNDNSTSNVQIGGGSGDHNSAELIQFFTSADHTTLTGTLRMLIDGIGNVGIGVTPEVWDTANNFKVLQAGTGAFFGGRGTAITNSQAFWGNNCYFDDTNDRWEHIGNSEVGLMEINDDGHLRYYNASAASDDSAVSFNTRFVIRNNGRVGVGIDAPDTLVHISAGSAGSVDAHSDTRLVVEDDDNCTIATLAPDANWNGFQMGSASDSTGAILQWNYNNKQLYLGTTPSTDGGFITFQTGTGTERVRINSDGNMGIGDNDPSEAKLSIDGVLSGDKGIKLVQAQAQYGFEIDQNGDNSAIYIDSAAQVSHALDIRSSSLTDGYVAHLYSNSNSTAGRKLVAITNDNDAALDAICVYAIQDAAGIAFKAHATKSDYGGVVQELVVTRDATSAYKFLRTYVSGQSDEKHNLKGDGSTQGDNAYSSPTSDYAEYFESKDGSAITVGTTVKLDEEKIVACEDGDIPLGVIRPYGTASVLGNNAWSKWNKKYLTDDYGSAITEEYTVTEWIDGKNEDGSNNDIQYHTDKIPSDVVVPDNATVKSVDENGNKLMRNKLNPDYDESKTYIPREDRDEWNIVGLLGQVEITKGQPVASNWIKMKDISDTVELWFIK